MERRRIRRSAALAVLLAVVGVGLSGCFDVVQTVGIDRSGAGRYQIAVTGQGVVGDAIKNEKLVNRQNHAAMSTSDVGGNVTRTATVDFKSLSDLAFSDETMNLKVTGRDFFGLGPSHVAFLTNVMIDKAKHDNERAQAGRSHLRLHRHRPGRRRAGASRHDRRRDLSADRHRRFL